MLLVPHWPKQPFEIDLTLLERRSDMASMGADHARIAEASDDRRCADSQFLQDTTEVGEAWRQTLEPGVELMVERY